MIKLLFLIPVFLMFFGCATPNYGSLNYSEHGLYSGNNPGNKEFEETGPVVGSDSGWLWDDCQDMIISAVKRMKEQAKSKGANKVYSVQFYNGKHFDDQPVCIENWITLRGYSSVKGIGAKAE